jgi:hypothetical protein
VVEFFEYANGEKSQASKKIALSQKGPPLSTRVGFFAAKWAAHFNLHYAIGQELQANM